jgi:hypothetical protein
MGRHSLLVRQSNQAAPCISAANILLGSKWIVSDGIKKGKKTKVSS